MATVGWVIAQFHAQICVLSVVLNHPISYDVLYYILYCRTEVERITNN